MPLVNGTLGTMMSRARLSGARFSAPTAGIPDRTPGSLPSTLMPRVTVDFYCAIEVVVVDRQLDVRALTTRRTIVAHPCGGEQALARASGNQTRVSSTIASTTLRRHCRRRPAQLPIHALDGVAEYLPQDAKKSRMLLGKSGLPSKSPAFSP